MKTALRQVDMKMAHDSSEHSQIGCLVTKGGSAITRADFRRWQRGAMDAVPHNPKNGNAVTEAWVTLERELVEAGCPTEALTKIQSLIDPTYKCWRRLPHARGHWATPSWHGWRRISLQSYRRQRRSCMLVRGSASATARAHAQSGRRDMRKKRQRRSSWFSGKPCAVCGGTERYRSHRGKSYCIACHRKFAADYRRRVLGQEPRHWPFCFGRKAALARGDRFYDGRACITCGNTKRFTRNSECAQCYEARERSPERVAQKRRAAKVRYHAAMNALRAMKLVMGMGGT
jgi:hypothetical protein